MNRIALFVATAVILGPAAALAHWVPTPGAGPILQTLSSKRNQELAVAVDPGCFKLESPRWARVWDAIRKAAPHGTVRADCQLTACRVTFLKKKAAADEAQRAWVLDFQRDPQSGQPRKGTLKLSCGG
jgi:hypothetical protein